MSREFDAGDWFARDCFLHQRFVTGKASAFAIAGLKAQFVMDSEITFLAGEPPHVPIGPNDPSVLRVRRLWLFLLTSRQARRISPAENGRRGEAPTCIYRHVVVLEHVGYHRRPSECDASLPISAYSTHFRASAQKLARRKERERPGYASRGPRRRRFLEQEECG